MFQKLIAQPIYEIPRKFLSIQSISRAAIKTDLKMSLRCLAIYHRCYLFLQCAINLLKIWTKQGLQFVFFTHFFFKKMYFQSTCIVPIAQCILNWSDTSFCWYTDLLFSNFNRLTQKVYFDQNHSTYLKNWYSWSQLQNRGCC